jgi:N6-L-threonylcarbamoyladenine synthase
MYSRLGRSHDDAAGEAFDKVARLLNLGYPGGPAIEQASQGGDPGRFVLPKGRVSRPEGGYYPYDFSFSGLKTAMLRQVRALEQLAGSHDLPVADLAASFEQVVVEVLVERSCACAKQQGLETLVLVGGVAANKRLRRLLEERCRHDGLNWRVAPLPFCTDNAAMIGVAAAQRLSAGLQSSMELAVAPRLPLEEASRLYQAQACF